MCSSDCGYIASPGFPAGYYSNLVCSWTIQLPNEAYINFQFLYFHVFEEESDTCFKDVVTVQDITRDGRLGEVFGQYCNTNKPPVEILSSWNGLHVEFISDVTAESEGFMAKYTSVVYTTLNITEDLDSSIDECKCTCQCTCPMSM